MLKPIRRGAITDNVPANETATVVAAVVVILAGACALPLAHADIYTWTDESGRVNVSNLKPPEGVRVTKVVHESAGNPVARDALREAEVRLLAERVRQLQDEVDLAKRPPPPQVIVQAAPAAPPIIQYITLPAPQYPVAAPVNSGCSFGWPDCTFGWYPGFYPVSVVVPRDKHFGRRPDHRSDDRADDRFDHRRLPSPTPGRGLIAPWLPITGPGGRGN